MTYLFLFTGNGYPVEFSRVYDNARADHPCRDENMLHPEEMLSISSELLASENFAACNEVFKNDLQ